MYVMSKFVYKAVLNTQPFQIGPGWGSAELKIISEVCSEH